MDILGNFELSVIQICEIPGDFPAVLALVFICTPTNTRTNHGRLVSWCWVHICCLAL